LNPNLEEDSESERRERLVRLPPFLLLSETLKKYRNVLKIVFYRDAQDILPAFLISGIRPDSGFDLPDIRPDTGY
jgi:hypothetical protein